jgi:hypothetical protein
MLPDPLSLRFPRVTAAGRAPWVRVVVITAVVASGVILAESLTPTAAHPASVLGVATPSWDTAPTWTDTLQDTDQPIAMSSPTVANLDGSPSVVVGDRRGMVYGVHLSDGSPAPGWPVTDGSPPVDSSPSVATQPNGRSTVFFGSGYDGNPGPGGYQAFDSTGAFKWFTQVVNPPTDADPAGGVQAGMSVGILQGTTAVAAGSLGQQTYALDAGNGAALNGWPYFNSDSTHSTAALADLYGTGQNQVILGGDQSAGAGQGQQYNNGGHIRVLSAQGNLICRADTNQVVDSSPAVGGFLPGGATGIVTGTGNFFPNMPDTNTVKAYDTRCNPQWSTTLDGSTFSSPALANISGSGALEVAQGTDNGTSGSIWVLNAANGAPIWHHAGLPRVIGSVVTADLFGLGDQDVIVPTINGAFIFDGVTGTQLDVLDANLGLQNSPLVTRDANGTVGITLAGYIASGTPVHLLGRIEHFEIPLSNGAVAVGKGSWPMFHHDPQLTGNAGGTTPQGSVPPCSLPAALNRGYSLFGSDGGIFSFGGAPFCGSTGNLRLNAPVVGAAMARSGGGYWEVASDGGIFAFGGAGFYGSMGGRPLNSPIVGMAATPDGKGYWEAAADGGIFAFGDAGFGGSMGGRPLNSPIVEISASTNGDGYRLVAADGGIFAFGYAPFYGSMGGQPLHAPIVGLTNDSNSGGYWEVAADGGVFAFGGAPFYGSTGGLPLNRPIVGLAETTNGSGYRFVSSDGGIFSFNAPFFGSMGGIPLNRPMVGMVGF